jgi:hypothetical protein
MNQEQELRQLWQKTLGTPPMIEQFGLWTALHAESVVRLAILRTARRNLDMKGAMDEAYKVKFASQVMLIQTARNTSNALNKQRLSAEFEGVSHGR